MMKLVLGADHGGFELKENIKEYLKEEGIEFTDYGTLSGDRCDYPDVAKKLPKLLPTVPLTEASSFAAPASASALRPIKFTASGQLFATIPFRQNSAAAITTPTF